MSVKTERPQVRTAQDLERKYALLLNSGTAIKQTETGLIKVNNILSQFIAATIGDLETLQQQLDGQIETWYGDTTPTLLNEPASNWQVSDYPDHVGDIYYDNGTGNTYQFINDNGTYGWSSINSSLMSEIFGIANAAKDTADNKRRVFVVQPTPPYDTGDIWIKNVGEENGEVYICQIAKEEGSSYADGDFIVATKYTDDTIALSAQQTATLAQEKALDVEATADRLDLNFNKRFVLNDDTVVDEKYSKITFEDGSIGFIAGNSRIKLVIDNDSIEFKDSSDIVIASWSATDTTATSSTLILGNFKFEPRENGSLGFRKVN